MKKSIVLLAFMFILSSCTTNSSSISSLEQAPEVSMQQESSEISSKEDAIESNEKNNTPQEIKTFKYSADFFINLFSERAKNSIESINMDSLESTIEEDDFSREYRYITVGFEKSNISMSFEEEIESEKIYGVTLFIDINDNMIDETRRLYDAYTYSLISIFVQSPAEVITELNLQPLSDGNPTEQIVKTISYDNLEFLYVANEGFVFLKVTPKQ